MSSRKHEVHVTDQFGPRANAYVTSAVHAQGEDLQQIASAVLGHGQARALDMGCGGGHVSFNVAPAVREVVAYDLSPDMLAAVTEEAGRRGIGNIVTRQGAAEVLPFADGEFDFVFSRFSAHHWHDFQAGIREARRVLKPGGLAIFADAYAPANPLLDTFVQSIEILRDTSHVRDYSLAEWTATARAAGFTPGAVRTRRLRLEFTSWVQRMRTPEVFVQAIRALEAQASDAVVRHFGIEPDGSFHLDCMTLEARG